MFDRLQSWFVATLLLVYIIQQIVILSNKISNLALLEYLFADWNIRKSYVS